jgi:hypothetical protein
MSLCPSHNSPWLKRKLRASSGSKRLKPRLLGGLRRERTSRSYLRPSAVEPYGLFFGETGPVSGFRFVYVIRGGRLA